MSVLEAGEKLLVVHRRLFEGDDNRYFLGEVQGFQDAIARVVGFTFVRDAMGGSVQKKEQLRTKLIALSSGTFLVYVLPPEVSVEAATIEAREAELRLIAPGFEMNLSEWTYRAM